MTLKEIQVVGAIIVKDGCILCVQRGPGGTLPYKWEFPGGKIEFGETPHQALARELQEELRVEVVMADHLYAEVDYVYDFGHVYLKTILCHQPNQPLTLTEHVDVKWVEQKQLNQLDWAPADWSIIDKLMKDTSWKRL